MHNQCTIKCTILSTDHVKRIFEDLCPIACITLGGDHEYNCGRGGCALLDDLEWNGDYAQPMQEGLVTAAGTGQTATNSLFLLCTRSDISRNFSCPFGEIIQGLDEVKDAIRKASMNEEEIWISDCGVVLEPPRA